MNPLQIILLVVVVIIAVTALSTYLVRKRYYSQIDELDDQKNKVLDYAPYEELKEVSEMNISGQSSEVRNQLEDEWRQIESVKYPKLENYLFEAEQATDRYRLNESKRNQEAAEEAITEIKDALDSLQHGLQDLIKREQANLEKIDEIKKRYHEVRKSLLAYSFSFGPASESFEDKLRLMENDFTEFSELTVSGDHEEANAIVEQLSKDIQETEDQMDQIPSLLEQIDDVYAEELKDLEEGYNQMIEDGFLFPEDNVQEKINVLKNDKELIYEKIRLLDLDEARIQIDKLADNIDALYQEMEDEIEAKAAVSDLLEDTKQAIYYLQDEYRRLNGVANRISQSYILNHEEEKKIASLNEQVKEAREEYDYIQDRVKHQALPYTVAYNKLEETFNQLESHNESFLKISDNLDNYRAEEMALKKDMQEMKQDMYAMKRRLENERLPGLPENYLELFFSTTDRIEQLSTELARPKIQLIEIRRLHEMCQEDVTQLEEMTEEVIRQVELTELVSQRLYRYKDDHKGVLETIRYSESLFSEDYEYDTALRLVREKLENVDSGAYKEIVQKYESEKEG